MPQIPSSTGLLPNPLSKLDQECETKCSDERIPNFLSSELLDPLCQPAMKWKDFKKPQLRQFPRQSKEIEWGQFLGAGAEGGVWKTRFGNNVFAVKVFWDAENTNTNYWPFKIEARNIAILEKVQWKVDHSQKLRVREYPKDRNQMLENLRQFSDDEKFADTEIDLSFTDQQTLFPRRACYGWIKIRRDELPRRSEFQRAKTLRLQNRKRLKPIDADHYFAIVYEYLPSKKEEDPKDLVDLGNTLKVLRYAGFTLRVPRSKERDNWIGGILIDFGEDLCSAFNYVPAIRWKPPIRYVAESFFFSPKNEE